MVTDVGSWADAMSNTNQDAPPPPQLQRHDSSQGQNAVKMGQSYPNSSMTSFDGEADGIVDYGALSNNDSSSGTFHMGNSESGLSFSSPKPVSHYVDDISLWAKDSPLAISANTTSASGADLTSTSNAPAFTTSPDESSAGGPTLTSPSDDVASFRSSPSYNTTDGFSNSTRTHSIDGTSIHSSFDQKHQRTSSMSSSSSQFPDYNAAAAAAAAAAAVSASAAAANAWSGGGPTQQNLVSDQNFAAPQSVGGPGVGIGSGGAGGYYNHAAAATAAAAPSAFRAGSASDSSLTPFGIGEETAGVRSASIGSMTSDQAAAVASIAAAQQGSVQTMGPPLALNAQPLSTNGAAIATKAFPAKSSNSSSSGGSSSNTNSNSSNISISNKRGQTSDGTKSSSSSSAGAGTTRRTKFRRSRTGCMVCRKRKVKCDQDGQPCKQCRIGKRDCHYEEAPQKRRRKTRTETEAESQSSSTSSSRQAEAEVDASKGPSGRGQGKAALGQAPAPVAHGLQAARAGASTEMPLFAQSLYSSTPSLLPAAGSSPTSMRSSSSMPSSTDSSRRGAGVSATLAPAVGSILAHSGSDDGNYRTRHSSSNNNGSMGNNDLPSTGVVGANTTEDSLLGPFSSAYSPSVIDDGDHSWPPDDWSTALDRTSVRRDSANDAENSVGGASGSGLFDDPLTAVTTDSTTTSSTQSLDEPLEGEDGLRLSEPPSSTLKASAGEEGVPLYDEHSPSTYLTSTSSSSEWGLNQEVLV